MAVVDVHISVFAPEGDQAVAQAQMRVRVPTVPPVVDALREVEWQLVKETLAAINEETMKLVLAQVSDYQEYLEARSALPRDHEVGGNGGGA